MSVYQYIYFAAVDKPLDDRQLQYMRRQSTRAEVTRWQFQNEYHYGDFHGNSLEMMRRGYDVHLHYANYGVRKLLFRLPLGLPISAKQFKAYATDYGIEWKNDKRGKGGIPTWLYVTIASAPHRIAAAKTCRSSGSGSSRASINGSKPVTTASSTRSYKRYFTRSHTRT